jgi:peptidoglycan/LPS O-acetylase OafA/YrhL
VIGFLKRASPSLSEIRPTYRADIDGLRAVAILSVVIYHFSPTALPGGFVGVDIFFVISGFLISGLIFKELQEGGFRFGDFYIRRIRRIFPALTLVMAFALVVGLFILTAPEYSQLSKHVVGGSAFAANLVQWREAGYFDTDSRLKPLLHLWSLGIEEQFYFFWPIVAVLAWRRRFGAILSALILASFCLNILRTDHHPVGAFYLPFGRAWELLAGALLAYQQAGRIKAGSYSSDTKCRLPFGFSVSSKDTSALLGMLLLVAAVTAIGPGSKFPGWWALLPVGGTVLLIWAGQGAGINGKLLSHPAFVFIGLISYPLYLWHWPLLAFLRISSEAEPSLFARIGAVALSFVLAALTYWLVERPLRLSRIPRVAIVAVLSAIMLLLFTAGYIGYRKNAPKPPRFQISDCNGFLDPQTDLYCRILGDPRLKKTFFIWGDSHANSWVAGVQALASRSGAKLVMIQHPGCPPVLGVRRSLGSGQAQACSSFTLAEHVLSVIDKVRPDHIILVARWSLYTFGLHSHGELIENTFVTTDPHGTATPETSVAALRQQLPVTLQRLARIAPVLVIKTAPTLHMPIESGLARDPQHFEPTLSEYRKYEAVPNEIIDQAARSVPGVSVFDPASVLCVKKCHAVLNGVRLYSDDSHLTDEGALLFPDALSRAIH